MRPGDACRYARGCEVGRLNAGWTGRETGYVGVVSARTDESDTMRVGTGGAAAVGRGMSDTERLGVVPGVGACSWP